MSRIIKFRTWDTQNKEFSEWTNRDPFFSTSEGKIFFWERTRNEDGSFGGDVILQDAGNRFILQQFTGLQDKNGVDIYDGDILKYDYRCSIYIGRKLDSEGKDIGAKYSEEKYDFNILYDVFWHNDTLEINDGEYFTLLNGWATGEIYDSKYNVEKTQYCDKGKVRALGRNFAENYGYGNYGICSEKCEVVGNIFENPELLNYEPTT